MAYRLLVTYKFADKNKRDGFYECVCDDKIEKCTLMEKGCIRYEYEVPETETELLLHEEWESRADQQAHLKQPTVGFIKGYKMRFKAETEIEELSSDDKLPDPNALFPNEAIPSLCYIKNAVRDPRIEIGDFTYYDDPDGADRFEEHVTHFYDFIGDRLIIGKFCSIAKGIEFVMNGANHKMDGVTAYPFYIMGGSWTNAVAPELDELPIKGDTVVGNDVWIGQNVTVMPGVHIGDGAIIGANSVVASDIPPYSVAVGDPCRVVRKRFDDETIAFLLELKWWDWDLARINDNLDVLSSGDIDKLRAL